MAHPKEAPIAAQQPINISSQGTASPHNLPMANTDTVVFNNNNPTDTASVTFLGAGASVFSNPPVMVPNGSSPGLPPQQPDVTVNYLVGMGGASHGPFSIQVGTGPLEIDVLDAFGNTNLPNAAIPNNGQVQFCDKSTVGGNVTFDSPLYDQNGNPVTSQPLTANTYSAPLTGRGTNKNVRFFTNMNVPKEHSHGHGGVGGGSGTIKIGG